MQLNRKGDYALRAMTYLAGTNAKIPHTIGEISQRSDVPKHFLAKILKDLTRADLLIVVKGAKGGYRLSRKPADITLLEIIEATVGPIALNVCVEGNDRCDRTDKCEIHPIWQKASEIVRGMFGNETLGSIHHKSRS
jgi:Rrf2 family protein